MDVELLPAPVDGITMIMTIRWLFVPAVFTLVLAAPLQAAAAGKTPPFDNGPDNQLGLTFSPDGKTAFWGAWNGSWGSSTHARRTIYTSSLQDGTWSRPATAVFSGVYSDDDPFVSPDGEWLYFASDRPMGTGDESRDTNIWRYGLRQQNRPEALSINSASAEYSPVVTGAGTLYFASERNGEQTQGDLYRALPVAEGFSEPELLGPAFNTHTGEWNIWVSANEDEIIFEASSRPTNISVPGDLYYSWHTPAGWTAAIPVSDLNTTGSDLMPRLHPDGELLYYATAEMGGHARIVTTDWRELRTRLRSAYAPLLMVANRSSHEVTFVDLSRAAITSRLQTGKGPHLLSNVANGIVLATGYGEFPKPHNDPVSSRPPFVTSINSRLTVIDVPGQSVLLDTVIDDCLKPHASWIVEQHAYVSCEEEARVRILDPENGRPVGQIDTRQRGSHVLSFEPGSRTLAISNTNSGSVTLADIDSRETRIIELAAGSEGALAIAGHIWVGNAIDGSVSVVDPLTDTVIGHIESVCAFPIAFSMDVQEQVWIACFASAELVAIDPEDFAVQRRFSLDQQPLNLVTHPTRRLAYVSYPRQNAIAEIDLESGQELRRIDVGMEPDGLRWARSSHPRPPINESH